MEELYVFIGALIYMGIHKEPRTRMYWNTEFNQGLYIPLQAIFPFATFSKSNDTAVSPVLRVIKKGYYLLSNKIWRHKVEPIVDLCYYIFSTWHLRRSGRHGRLNSLRIMGENSSP
jgi:hypothetical protein